jgi:hypothetical protein
MRSGFTNHGRVAIAAAILTVIAGLIANCTQTGELAPCDYPDPDHYDKDGIADPCHCDDDAGTVGKRDPGGCNREPADASAEGP